MSCARQTDAVASGQIANMTRRFQKPQEQQRGLVYSLHKPLEILGTLDLSRVSTSRGNYTEHGGHQVCPAIPELIGARWRLHSARPKWFANLLIEYEQRDAAASKMLRILSN